MPATGPHTHQPDTGVITMTQPTQQPVQPPAAPHIPGLITASGGVTPAAAPGQPIPAAQPGTYVPAPDPVAAPAPQQAPVLQLPTSLLPAPTTTNSAVPGLLPAVVPGLAAPAPVTAQPAAPAQQPAPPATGNEPAERGYPEGTPLEQMTGEQREAYWKFHSRKWEGLAKERADFDAIKAKADQYDHYVASQATETEKQIAAARADGERIATARAAVVLVDAHVRAGLQQRLQPHQVEALASNLNHQHFLGPDGLTVDAAKVLTFVDTVAPQTAAPAVTVPAVPATPGALPVGVPQTVVPGQPAQPATGLPRALPDLGQGAQTLAPLDKLEAGRQQARAFLANGGHR